jgi:hypothetical protein
MKLITILFCIFLLVSGSLAAETKVPLDRLNWDQSLPANANITLNNGSVYSLQTDGIKNIKSYGAVGDNASDDTDNIQAAFDDMVQGDVMIVPTGRFNISSVVFDPPDDCSLLCYGNFSCYTTTPTTAFTIGSNTTTSRRYNIQGLRVISEDIDWTLNRTGINIRNVQECYIDIREVDGFEVNILAQGENGKGNAYNEYHLGLIFNGKSGLVLNTVTSGWTNENTFYGGRFSIQSGLSDYSDTYHIILLEGSPVINNNRFICPSFEGGSEVVSVDNYADYTLIMWPRLETIGNIVLESTSQGCEVHGGRGVYQSEIYSTRVVDLGARNKVFGYDTTTLAGSSAENATLQLKATGSTAYKALTIISSANAETGHIYGNGTVYSAAQGRFATGIGVGNSKAATTPGSVVKKIQVFDKNGNSLGYLAVYDGIS